MMEVDGESSSSSKGKEEKTKAIVVILVGAPGSGKSTFCDHVMRLSTRPWVRICQDIIGNGKAGTKTQCLASAASALKDGKSVFIDRCNLDREQRADFLKLGSPLVDVQAVVLDLPAKLCISRCVNRTAHEGNLQGGKAAAVVNRMLQKKESPSLSEGFSRITFCLNESDVQSAISTYGALGPLQCLQSGLFGGKQSDAKIQLGIMKFLKKVEAPVNAVSKGSTLQDSFTTDSTKGNNSSDRGPERIRATVVKGVKQGEALAVGSVDGISSLSNIPTLAFPSISTADFQFNLEKASDIIVEKVKEFVTKIGNARLVLVDVSRGSKILSLVKVKAAEKNINPHKFLTFVGDITQLHSVGGLHCNVIANAANWRLKPGGGGVNAAIFSAAGSALEIATKERAGSLSPGKAVVVPLPSTSPLFSREGVTHVIHVLGPNMNPKRPDFLNNDYTKGCKVLREAYSSLFEGFASVLGPQDPSCKERPEKLGSFLSDSPVNGEISYMNQFSSSDQKVKREGVYETEEKKKCKVFQEELGSKSTGAPPQGKNSVKREEKNRIKAWGQWAQALHNFAMQAEKHKNEVLEISDDIVVLNDLYPKAKRHLLVLARHKGLDQLADVRKEHLQLLRTMHAVGLKWAEKFLSEDEKFVFRLGYHSAPSMRQLHLHVISQDFDSKHLKNKKHWNSFNTDFFRDSVDVLEEIEKNGQATLKDDDRLMSMELRCNRCRSAHPNLPRLKMHIGYCQTRFPASMLQNGHLVLSPNENGTNQ